MLINTMEVEMKSKVFDRARRGDGKGMASPAVSVNDNCCGRGIGLLDSP